MLPIKLRLKILNKLAQAVPGAPASPASPASPSSPASPAAPTTPATSTTSITKAPSPPASSMMNLPIGWTNWAQQINKLVAKVDAALIAGTAKKYNFNDLYQNKFPSGVDTEFPPPDPTKEIIGFGRLIYQYMLNGGVPYRGPLNHDEMRRRVNILLSSPQLQKFQQVNVKGPLGNMGVDLTSMRNDLLSLYNSIPAR